MRILVTGGAGFIGANLCKRLLEDGNFVIAVDNLITSDRTNLKLLTTHPNFKFIKHDITKPFPKNFKLRTSNFELIYHLACPTGVPNLGPLAEEMLLTCSLGTLNILEIAKKTGAKLLFTSSSEVYGDPQVFPQKEDYTGNVDPTGARSPYEEGKRFSESLVSAFSQKFKIDAKIVRVFNTYGPLMNKDDSRVIPRFLNRAFKNKPIPVHGSGMQKRTFCYVDDLVEGLILVLEKGKKGEVYNLGSDQEITIINLAKLVMKFAKSKSKIKFALRPPHDHQRRLPSLSKVKKLGFRLKTPLPEGLRATIAEHLI